MFFFSEMGDSKLLWQGVDSFFKIISLPFMQETLAIFCSQNFSTPLSLQSHLGVDSLRLLCLTFTRICTYLKAFNEN